MSAPHPFTRQIPEHLLQQTREELDALFALLPAPTATAIEGSHRGRLMAIVGAERLPRSLARSFYRLLGTPLNPWRGKSFASGAGENRWLAVRGVPFGRFRAFVAPSPVDGRESLLLDYDLAENPRLLRPILGEARRLDATRLLARMSYRAEGGLARILYFTLDLADGAT